ncbi:MAG: DUF4249 family protein [Bacteroidetes bacterium]|nr:DUF4249 family protein [Bacteroidota bacterium]
MKKYEFISCLIMMVVLSVSCEKEVTNIDVTNVISKPVVFCVLNPADSIIEATFNYSVTIFEGKNHPDPLKAEIFLSSDDTIVQMFLDSNRLGGYDNYFFKTDSTKIKIRPGKTYHLEIRNLDYPVATASCTVPPDNPIIYSVHVDKIESVSIGYTLTVTGNPEEEAFYDLHVQSYLVDENDTSYLITQANGYEIFTNEHLSSPVFVRKGIINISDGWSYWGDHFLFHLCETDENYYNYHKMLALLPQFDWQQGPEPVIMTTNITNGFGLFGAVVEK